MALKENYRKLNWKVRSRILDFLIREAEDEILADPEIRQALQAKKLSLTPEDLESIRRCAEFRTYQEKCSQDAQSRNAERITSAVLENTQALGHITDVARYELAKLVRSLIADTDHESELPEKIKAVSTLSRSLAALTSPAAERRIMQKDAEISRLQTLLEEKESEIARLRELTRNSDSARVIQSLNEQVGL